MKLVFIITFTIVSALFTPLTDKNSSHSAGSFPVRQSLNTCPADNDLTRTNMELFISHPEWSDNRTATGTNGLSVSQLQVLTDSQNSSVCQYFNSEFDDTINETWSKGGSKYHVVYYKAGSFYFVSIVIAQPSDPEYVSVGLSFLIIFDNNLNEIKGYSF